ncbi:hypothetical protein HJFPF1_00067 [Paramyrothecium foliicola]|nr:hypothetical protein HJFPF1_00067 [Paramyrothecium foliicola]
MDEPRFIRLTTKPTAQISYRFQESQSSTLLVFLNGLGLPQVAWLATIQRLKDIRGESNLPNILTYDRFGQGQTTDRDPDDATSTDPMHGHDCLAIVEDLRQLLGQIALEHMSVAELDSVTLVFVSNSIGCAVARLYAQQYSGSVAAHLLLDSVLANSDFISIFPDPDEEGFEQDALPDGMTVEALRGARASTRAIFHPSVGSKEGLSRKNLSKLLPASNLPVLQGPDGHGPFVTVVGHDFETFSQQSTRMGFPQFVTKTYVNPYWDEYNRGLVQITEQTRAKGPMQAPQAGHFIQKDNPEFVAQELDEILSKVMPSIEKT